MNDDPVIIREGAILDIEQGSRAWYDARKGMLTASYAYLLKPLERRSRDKQTGRVKEAGEPSAAYENHKLQVVCEILTGNISEHYKSIWMERGNELEPEARRAYESRMEIDVDRVGFVLHPRIARFGCSPDCLVGEDGGAEFKVPKPETHLRYMLADAVPKIYMPQITAQLSCTGRKWWDFMSYCPDFPKGKQEFIKRVYRDEDAIAQQEKAVEQFLREVDEMVKRVMDGEARVEDLLRESIRRAQTRRKLEHEREDMPDELYITDEDIRL